MCLYWQRSLSNSHKHHYDCWRSQLLSFVFLKTITASQRQMCCCKLVSSVQSALRAAAVLHKNSDDSCSERICNSTLYWNLGDNSWLVARSSSYLVLGNCSVARVLFWLPNMWHLPLVQHFRLKKFQKLYKCSFKTSQVNSSVYVEWLNITALFSLVM